MKLFERLNIIPSQLQCCACNTYLLHENVLWAFPLLLSPPSFFFGGGGGGKGEVWPKSLAWLPEYEHSLFAILQFVW